MTNYLLYVEHDTGAFVIMTTHPLNVAEDHLVTIGGEEGNYTFMLTPRVSKHKMVVLEQYP